MQSTRRAAELMTDSDVRSLNGASGPAEDPRTLPGWASLIIPISDPIKGLLKGLYGRIAQDVAYCRQDA